MRLAPLLETSGAAGNFVLSVAVDFKDRRPSSWVKSLFNGTQKEHYKNDRR